MTNSTFYHDGYRVCLNGEPFSPPDSYHGTDVLASEYKAGYQQAEIDWSMTSQPTIAVSDLLLGEVIASENSR